MNLFKRLFKDKYEQFNPENFEENSEDYFIHLQKWKVKAEKDYQNFTPRRQKHISTANKRINKRLIFCIFNLFEKCIVVVDIYNLVNREKYLLG